jgi:hypothetical protein
MTRIGCAFAIGKAWPFPTPRLLTPTERWMDAHIEYRRARGRLVFLGGTPRAKAPS